MAKAKGKKNGSLTNSLENKLTDLIYRMLEEKTLEKQRQLRSQADSSQEDEEMDIMDATCFAKDLVPGEIFTYVLSKDLSLQRVKKVPLQKR